MDEDGNGTIDFQEFLLYMLEKINKQSLTEDIIEIFSIFDRDNSGYITPIELKMITESYMKEKDIDEFLEIADIDGEGQINYKKFIEAFLKWLGDIFQLFYCMALYCGWKDYCWTLSERWSWLALMVMEVVEGYGVVWERGKRGWKWK